MNKRNFTQVTFQPMKNYKKKTFIINKLQKQSIIPNLKEKKDLLFEDPENYLKLPTETNFHFVVDRKPKGPRLNSSKKLIPYSVVGYYLEKPQSKKVTRKNVLSNSVSSKSLIRKNLKNSKTKIAQSNDINESSIKEEKKRKKTYRENVTYTEIYDIFNKSRKRINKNFIENLKYKNNICKEVPKLMQQYINEPLSQQERALKNNEKYNNILKRIEKNISKSLKNKLINKKVYNESICLDKNKYYSSNLIQNSGIDYRTKIEKIILNDKKKTPNLILNNHVQNWEMSLRRPRNFKGERREYLNVRTDKNPYWIILTEKNPFEEEKIINPNNNNNNKILLKTVSNNYDYKSIKPLDIKKIRSNTNDKINLKIKGKKIIDIEEKIANKMKGNIKMIDLKYDKESLKDLKIKTNYSINKHSFI